jgi:mRNA-degrading endonuclease RelE of RelBE toxin-antitoxin system
MQNESSDNQSVDSDSHKTQPIVQVDLTPECHKSLRSLAKRYRSIQADIQSVTQELESGNFIGDRIPRIGEDCTVFKVRIRNRDIQKGKSSGYRLIYQVEPPTSVLLLTIYSKSEQADITAKEIREIIDEFYKRG